MKSPLRRSLYHNKATMPHQDAWQNLRAQVFEQHGRACFYCDATPKEMCVDHVMPLRLGGTNDLNNLVPACRACNTSKGSHHPYAWEGRKGTRWHVDQQSD